MTVRKLVSILLSVAMLCTMLAVPAMADYADGTFTGSGAGLWGDVTVNVTVVEGKIAAIDLVSSQETEAYFATVWPAIPDAIIAAQSTDVDIVAGATYASQGVIDAVKAALGEVEAADAAADQMPFEKPDVIVIGAGLAGLTTAARAAELGLNVLVLEQTGTVGGSGNVAGGTLLGCGTRIQMEAGIEDDPALCFADFVRLGGAGTFNEAIAYEYAEISGEAVDWLDDLGCDFGDRVPYYGVYQPLNVARNYSGNGGAIAFVKALYAELEKYLGTNAYVSLNTKVTGLDTNENGAVIGCTATMPDGSTQSFEAPYTVVCTGGYGGSEEMLTKYNFTNILTTSPDCVTGDGYVWLEQLNAAFTNMDFCTSYAGGIRTNTEDFRDFAYINTQSGSLWIDTKGERIMDEMGADSHDRSETWANADQNKVYVCFTTEMLQPDAKLFSTGAWGSVREEFEPFMETLIEKGVAWKADSVEELAQKAGLPVDAFTATVADYNAGCAAGVDSVGRTAQLVPMENGPFYAVESIPYVMITSGGPMMNTDCQVINNDGLVIEGVYIAGEIVGMANVGGLNSIGGMGNGNCLVWGKHAAEVIAAKVYTDLVVEAVETVLQ